jgi:hypothetical protein
VTCTETFAATSGVLGNKHNKVRRSEIYFLTSDVLQNKNKIREVYKNFLRKGEK